jgi:hypothetical protein
MKMGKVINSLGMAYNEGLETIKKSILKFLEGLLNVIGGITVFGLSLVVMTFLIFVTVISMPVILMEVFLR